ncbi:hypothetical protein DPMN_084866 [Dreissena polymorpha]|uniref:Uncharacterized protein n=1 Tax=Dreissena polymorpha TaxID=45954 RepID=A0A9D3YFB8_DREPO|nr:hypothetical protein DPMN_084866 [Dreissena polymorpha]
MPRPLLAMFFQATRTIFKIVQYIIETNLLTKFHEDQKLMWLLEKNATPPWRSYIIGTNCLTKVLIRKNAPPPGGHVFKTTEPIFKLIQDIIGTNLLTMKYAMHLDSHVL